MARRTTAANHTTTRKPGLLSRLRHRNDAKVTRTEHTNPITGTRTTTKKTKTHPNGVGHHGHGGQGPLSSSHHHHHRTTTTSKRSTTTARTTGTHHHHRKASLGDKVSGAMMKLRGSLTNRPGKKVSRMQKCITCTQGNR